MTVFRRDDSDAPAAGTWSRVILDGKVTAVARCPLCSAKGYLDDHEIGAGGQVTPSVKCATSGCGFHDSVTLAGWLS